MRTTCAATASVDGAGAPAALAPQLSRARSGVAGCVLFSISLRYATVRRNSSLRCLSLSMVLTRVSNSYRLADKIIGTAIDSALDVAELVQGGNHDDGDVAGVGVVLEPPADLESAHLGHHHVEQDQVGLAFGHHIEGLHPVVGRHGPAIPDRPGSAPGWVRYHPRRGSSPASLRLSSSAGPSKLAPCTQP